MILVMLLGGGVLGAGLIGGIYAWMYSICHNRGLAVALTGAVLVAAVLVFMLARHILAAGVNDLQEALNSVP